ncbi:cAMP-specific 3',5'-cyclic phosphodiesterase 7B [Homalodisca vitripennis]|nr:cAMP-specific 3',5'-cyclic phosphodiesterase 7B [Homalodisca vitripennis]
MPRPAFVRVVLVVVVWCSSGVVCRCRVGWRAGGRGSGVIDHARPPCAPPSANRRHRQPPVSHVQAGMQQQCGLCTALADLFRRIMCIGGSRRGSGDSYYHELDEEELMSKWIYLLFGLSVLLSRKNRIMFKILYRVVCRFDHNGAVCTNDSLGPSVVFVTRIGSVADDIMPVCTECAVSRPALRDDKRTCGPVIRMAANHRAAL